MARWDESRGAWRVSVAAYRPGEPRRRRNLDLKAPNTRAGRRQAEAVEARLRVEVLDELEFERPGGSVAGSFAAAAHAWVDRHPDWSPKTIKETRYALRRYILPALGVTEFGEVSPAQIEDLYARWTRVGYAAPTRRRWHGIIHSIYADATRLGLVRVNPMARVTPAGGAAPERMHIPDKADIRRVIDAAASPSAATYFEIAVATGARRGTIAALKWHQIDLDTGAVLFSHAISVGENGAVRKGTKANRPYTVELGPTALEAVRAHYRRAAETALALGTAGDLRDLFVFSRNGGTQHWSVEYPTHAWAIACGRAGVTGCRLHDLRHFAATQMLTHRVSYRTVAERLGCTEANVIKTYSHRVAGDEDRRAAEIMAAIMA
jgi:integrase